MGNGHVFISGAVLTFFRNVPSALIPDRKADAEKARRPVSLSHPSVPSRWAATCSCRPPSFHRCSAFLRRHAVLAFRGPSRVATHPARALLWLLFEPCHSLGVSPARACQITVVLVSIFFQPTPHVSLNLVSPDVPSSHAAALTLFRTGFAWKTRP